MRKLMLGIAAIAVCSMNIGCILPAYSSDPVVRARELIYTSEGLRHIPDIWERIWALELPDLATPYRTSGGVI